MYLNNRVLADLRKEGYVLTEDANATASDIVKPAVKRTQRKMRHIFFNTFLHMTSSLISKN